MKPHSNPVTRTVAKVQEAHRSGRLNDYKPLKAVKPADDSGKSMTSWGPQMKR